MTDHKILIDLASISVAISTVAGWLPPIAALFSILWVCFQFYHSKPVKEWQYKRSRSREGSMKRRVQLVPEWRLIARKAWSVRFMGISAIAQLTDYLGLLSDYVPAAAMRWVVLASVTAAIAARFIKQGAISGDE